MQVAFNPCPQASTKVGVATRSGGSNLHLGIEAIVEAFGGSPGIHQGMIEAMLKDLTKVANVGKPTVAEISKAEDDATEAVKAALLISGADEMRFGRLKDKLANNYLLGTDQYPDTYDKAVRSLGATRRVGRAGHTKETALKAVLHSFSKEEKGADTEVVEEAQDVAHQQMREQMQVREKQAPRRQDPVIKQARTPASKSIKQETLSVTPVGKQITGCTSART